MSEIKTRSQAAVIVAIVVVCFVTACGLWAAEQGKGAKPRRARPPKWDERSKGVFFNDLEKALVGPRPDYSSGGSKRPTGPSSAGNPASHSPPSGGIYAWSKLISPESIEDEVKTLNQEVDAIVTTPQRYAAGDYRTGQRHFAMLAVMFAIVAEYDSDVRWKDRSISAREMFSLTGFGSRVGSIQAFNQAKKSKQALADLIRGDAIPERSAEAKAEWGKVAYRPPLMHRLKQAHEGRLLYWTANAGAFKKNKDAILHEAEILAALAEVIGRDGFEFADDDEFLDYCKQMRDAAIDVTKAVKLDNPEMARKAVGQIGKSCSECHEGYRS